MIEQPLHYFRKMTLLKKVLIVFLILVIFIIIVEQPGGDESKRRKGAKFFAPKLIAENVARIEISKLASDYEKVSLKKEADVWRVSNGQSFPADSEKIYNFLSALNNLKEDSVVSKNPERMALFGVDENSALLVQAWDLKERIVTDFYAGKSNYDGFQYLRKTDENQVIEASDLSLFLGQTKDDWKDKTLLSADEADVRRIAIQSPQEEMVLEKKQDVWRVIQPVDHEADSLSIRTLFEQLKKFKADSFAEAVEGSQADFEKPDYKISVRLQDDSLKLVLFKESEKEGIYFAKNGENNMIYLVSSPMIEGIFGLEFRASDSAQ